MGGVEVAVVVGSGGVSDDVVAGVVAGVDAVDSFGPPGCGDTPFGDDELFSDGVVGSLLFDVDSVASDDLSLLVDVLVDSSALVGLATLTRFASGSRADDLARAVSFRCAEIQRPPRTIKSIEAATALAPMSSHFRSNLVSLDAQS